jgi:hypothetical protein
LKYSQTIINFQGEPEIESAFYFDLALRTFLAIKAILQNGLWPPNMKYLTCDEYDGTNSPDHLIDLRSAFVEVRFFERLTLMILLIGIKIYRLVNSPHMHRLNFQKLVPHSMDLAL